MVIRAWMWPPYIAGLAVTGQKPFLWSEKYRLEHLQPVTAKCRHKEGPNHCTGCHSFGCSQRHCLNPAVAGGIAVWRKTPKLF